MEKKWKKNTLKKPEEKCVRKKKTYKFLFLKKKIINQNGHSMENEENKDFFKAVYTALGK